MRGNVHPGTLGSGRIALSQADLENSLRVVGLLSKESVVRLKPGDPCFDNLRAFLVGGKQRIAQPGQPGVDSRIASIVPREQDCRRGNPRLDEEAEKVDDTILEGTLSAHSSSPVGVGTPQGKTRAGAGKAAFPPLRPAAPHLTTTSTWRTPMRRFLAVCRRLDDHWVGDVIGVVFLFSLIPAVLFLGALFGGGTP
jgi:hypothetical protein